MTLFLCYEALKTAFYFLLNWWWELTMKTSSCLLYKYISAQHLIAGSRWYNPNPSLQKFEGVSFRKNLWLEEWSCICAYAGWCDCQRGVIGLIVFMARALPLTSQSDFVFECVSEYLFSTYLCTVIRNKVLAARMQKSEVDFFFFSRGFCLSESLLSHNWYCCYGASVQAGIG